MPEASCFKPAPCLMMKNLAEIASGFYEIPFGILCCNQSFLLCARPIFDLFLACNGLVDICVRFEVKQVVTIIASCKGPFVAAVLIMLLQTEL